MPPNWNQRLFTTCLTATTTCYPVQTGRRHQPRPHRSAHAVSARDDVVVGPMLQHSVHAMQPRRRKWQRTCSSVFELARHHAIVPSPPPPSSSPSPSPLSPSSPSPLPPHVTPSSIPLPSPPPPLPPVDAALTFLRRSANTVRGCLDAPSSPPPSLLWLPRTSFGTFYQLRFTTVRAARLLVLVVHGGGALGL